MQFLATIVQGPHHSISGAYTIPPFRFQPRNRSMDWRRMSVLDVDRVTQELDVAILQENLTDITFCTFDQEVCSHCSQPLDQALLNVLRLAQLTIEYMMHCQDFLMTRVTELEQNLQASLSQQSQSQQQLDCQTEDLRGLQEERHRQRKMIKDLQQLLQWSSGKSYYMCHLCEEMFLSASCLQSHLQHKHEGKAQGEKQKQEESMEEVVRDLRAQLTSTQEELTALLKQQRQQQEAKTTCQRDRDAKAMFEEWIEELSEEIDQQKKVFWDELKSSVLPDSPLEEKPAAPQPHSVMCSNLESLQDAECEELLGHILGLEALRILKEVKIQGRKLRKTFHELEKELAAKNKELQDKNQELQRKNKILQRENHKQQKEKDKLYKVNEGLQEESEKAQENEKVQKEYEKLQKENEKLQRVNKKLQKVNERLQEESEKAQENEKVQKEYEKLWKENKKLQRVNKKLQKVNDRLQEESEKAQENEKVQKEYEKLQKENEKLQRVNKKLRKVSERLHKVSEKIQEEGEQPVGKEKLQKKNEKLQKKSEKLRKENERLHDMLCQLHATASQSQQHIVSLSTQMQQQARLITSQEMTQTSLRRKVKGSPKDLKTVNKTKKSSIEVSEGSQEEQQEELEAQGQNISLRELFGQTLGNDLQQRQESTGRKRDAKEVPTRTFRHSMKQSGEKKEGKFSLWFSKASGRAAGWFLGSGRRARRRW